MGLKRVMSVRRYQGKCVGRYDPWGIKATGFAVTTKINHYAAVTPRLLTSTTSIQGKTAKSQHGIHKVPRS